MVLDVASASNKRGLLQLRVVLVAAGRGDFLDRDQHANQQYMVEPRQPEPARSLAARLRRATTTSPFHGLATAGVFVGRVADLLDDSLRGGGRGSPSP